MKPWQIKALLLLTSILVSLIVAEAGLRLFKIEYPSFFDFDPFVGLKLRPGLKGYWLQEGGGYVSINSDGLRGREHVISKPPHTLRIAVLGDSFTEAFQVNQEENFCAILEKNLKGCSNLEGRQVEVINFGQSGFGTAQELLALRHWVWKYSPDVVLLAIFTGNDISDNSRALKPENQQENQTPYFVYQGNRLVLDDRLTREKWAKAQDKDSWWRQFARWRFDHFRVIQVLTYVQRGFPTFWASQENKDGAHQEIGIYDNVYLPPTTEVWQEAWRVTEGLLLLMRDEIYQRGAKFYIVVLSNAIQVHPDPNVRAEFAQKLGVNDLFYPDRRLEDFCRRANIPVLLLAPRFQDYATAHKVYFHGFKSTLKNTLGSGHWNQNGHRLAGEMLAEWLCRKIH
jgi:hypothetical protein